MTVVTGPAWTDGSDGRYAGRYPLAVERHNMSQVGRLLPGITTVTSHARYYTLHAWVFAEAQARALDGAATRRLFRRAEVVLGAVSLAHAAHADHHGLRGVHGGDRLASKVTSGAVDVDAMAADGGYVQQGWGFWGPYAGPEYALGLLADEGRKTVPGPKADPTALRDGFEGLSDLTAQSVLSSEDLARASHLCVCNGPRSADGALLRSLLVPADVVPMHAEDRRAQTLRLLLRLTDLLHGVERPEGELQNALVYGSERDDAQVGVLDVAAAWTGLVLRNEMVAGWRNLWEHLVASIDGFMAIDTLAALFADGLPNQTVGELIASLPDGIGPDGGAVDAFAALRTQSLSPEMLLLARLVISAYRYGRLERRVEAYFQSQDETYEQLTPSWTRDRLTEWGDRPVRDFAVWLTHQLVARAERVAMTKATFDRRTGRFKVPTRVFVRDGYVFRDSHEGGGGVALRWSSAFQIMAGVGLVAFVDGRWQVTEQGKAV